MQTERQREGKDRQNIVNKGQDLEKEGHMGGDRANLGRKEEKKRFPDKGSERPAQEEKPPVMLVTV